MNVVPFPLRPTISTTAPLLLRIAPQFPEWSMECFEGDDGLAWVFAASTETGGCIAAHWADGCWAIFDEDLSGNPHLLSRATSLPDALRRALV